MSSAWLSREDAREAVDKWLTEKPQPTSDMQQSLVGHENSVVDEAFEAEQQQKMMSLFE